jgi:heme-binding NEAT domain protein
VKEMPPEEKPETEPETATETETETETESETAPEGPDVDTLNAKIQALTDSHSVKDALIADLTNQIVAAKAANYDLLVSSGSTPVETVTEDDGDGPDIDDFFGD